MLFLVSKNKLCAKTWGLDYILDTIWSPHLFSFVDRLMFRLFSVRVLRRSNIISLWTATADFLSAQVCLSRASTYRYNIFTSGRHLCSASGSQQNTFSLCSLAPTSTPMRFPWSSHSRTRILWETTSMSFLRYQLCSLQPFLWCFRVFLFVTWSCSLSLYSRGMTCGRTCWPCRLYGSWTRSGSRKGWTWGWSSSVAFLLDGAEVKTKNWVYKPVISIGLDSNKAHL